MSGGRFCPVTLQKTAARKPRGRRAAFFNGPTDRISVNEQSHEETDR